MFEDFSLIGINYWHWLALASLLSIADIIVGANLFLILCGVSAAFVAGLLVLFPQMLWEYQLLTFAITTFVSFLFWRKKLKSLHAKEKYTINKRSAYYIGRKFTLEEAIVNGRGKIRVDDTIWLVSGEDMPVGSSVKVVDVEGVVLKVKQA